MTDSKLLIEHIPPSELKPYEGNPRIHTEQQIEKLKSIYDVAPMSVCLSMFKDAKMDELVNIYSKANSSEKEKVYELLYPLYPTETERLNKIKNTDSKP